MPGFGTWSKSIIFMVKTFAVYVRIELLTDPQFSERIIFLKTVDKN